MCDEKRKLIQQLKTERLRQNSGGGAGTASGPGALGSMVKNMFGAWGGGSGTRGSIISLESELSTLEGLHK